MEHELVIYIPFFIDQLRHLHPDHRDLAIDELAAIGQPAIPALYDAVFSDHYFARTGAAESLCKMDMPPAREVLLEAFEQTDFAEVRRVILKHLSAYFNEARVASALLRVAQKDTYIMWWVRRMGVEGRMIKMRIFTLETAASAVRNELLSDYLRATDGTALQLLRAMLTHDDPELRHLAAVRLASDSLYHDTNLIAEPREFARARSVQALMDAFNDEPDAIVRICLVQAIGHYREFALQVKIVLKLAARSDPNANVREAARLILAEFNTADEI